MRSAEWRGVVSLHRRQHLRDTRGRTERRIPCVPAWRSTKWNDAAPAAAGSSTPALKSPPKPIAHCLNASVSANVCGSGTSCSQTLIIGSISARLSRRGLSEIRPTGAITTAPGPSTSSETASGSGFVIGSERAILQRWTHATFRPACTASPGNRLFPREPAILGSSRSDPSAWHVRARWTRQERTWSTPRQPSHNVATQRVLEHPAWQRFHPVVVAARWWRIHWREPQTQKRSITKRPGPCNRTIRFQTLQW